LQIDKALARDLAHAASSGGVWGAGRDWQDADAVQGQLILHRRSLSRGTGTCESKDNNESANDVFHDDYLKVVLTKDFAGHAN